MVTNRINQHSNLDEELREQNGNVANYFNHQQQSFKHRYGGEPQKANQRQSPRNILEKLNSVSASLLKNFILIESVSLPLPSPLSYSSFHLDVLKAQQFPVIKSELFKACGQFNDAEGAQIQFVM